MNKTIGIIGLGNMGSAIAGSLKKNHRLFIFDKDRAKAAGIKAPSVIAVERVGDLLGEPRIIVLAVKPQDLAEVLKEIKPGLRAQEKQLFISIAAGISTGYIERELGALPLVRAMPNLPMKIARGMICLCKGRYARDADLEEARALFLPLGKLMTIEESLMNAATAVSGSGPGFFFALARGKRGRELAAFAAGVFAPLLARAAEEAGFGRKQAEFLAAATASGSLALLAESGLSADDLVRQVASKGGTTQAGLEVLQGSQDNLNLAVKAALKRAEELAGGG